MSLGGGGFVSSNGLFNVTYKGSYSASLPAGITAVASNVVHYWQAGPLFIGAYALATSAASAGSGDLTLSLPSGLTWNASNLPVGATTSNQSSPVLGFGQFFIQGGGWKYMYPNYAGSTQVYFAENTQHIQANELTTGDSIKGWFIGPVNEWS